MKYVSNKTISGVCMDMRYNHYYDTYIHSQNRRGTIFVPKLVIRSSNKGIKR